MGPDGNNVVNLTRRRGTPNRAPAWSPDGQWIAFQSHRTGNWEIFVMDSNGANETQVTNHPGGDGSPRWVIPEGGFSVSPQGKHPEMWGCIKSEQP